MFLISFTSSVELVGPELKTFWGNLIHVPFQIGGLIVTLIAYLERDWVMFQVSLQYVLLKFDEIHAIFSCRQIYSSIPIFLVLLLFFITPESPRWLIAKGRNEEAAQVIRRAAKMNKVIIMKTSLK
jgi:hypothetical protein